MMTGKKSLKKKEKRKEKGDGIKLQHAAGGHTHPKRFKNPNISTNTPIVGHLKKTRRIPPRKQAVPRSLFLRAKK